MTLKTVLFVSASLGIAAFATCWSVLPQTQDLITTQILVTTAFFLAWAGVQAFGIWKYRWRGLWLLLGLPLVLLYPSLLFWIEWACEHGNLNACT